MTLRQDPRTFPGACKMLADAYSAILRYGRIISNKPLEELLNVLFQAFSVATIVFFAHDPAEPK